MPRTVDHDERRRALADALARVAARDGLQAISMRSVATEAEVSLRSVQYYFPNRRQLLVGAMRRLEELSNERWSGRLGAAATPREVLDAFIVEALPTDDASRDFYLVSSAFTELAKSDPALAAEPLAGGVGRLRGSVARAFERADAADELAVGADPERETDALISLCNGLSTAVLIGHHTPHGALAIARYQLDRAFTPTDSPDRGH